MSPLRIACILPTLLGFLLAANSPALTFVLDFNDPTQANTFDGLSSPPFTAPQTANEVSTFNVTSFGFLESDRAMLTDSILNQVRSHYYDIPTVDVDSRSPIPAGHQLNVDFVIGDIGFFPSNGDDEFYFMQIGTAVSGSQASVAGILGVAAYAVIRNETGIDPINGDTGYVWGSIFSDRIQALGQVGNALSSGNLTATVNALAGTISHELAHTLSLEHVAKAGSVTPSGTSPLMGTGAVDLPNADRILDREFSYSGFDGATELFNVQVLVDALGVRPIAIPEPSSFALGLLAFLTAGVRWWRVRF